MSFQWLRRALIALIVAAPMAFGATGAFAATSRVNGHEKVNRQAQPLPLATEIARNASHVARHMDTVGWCYAGVKQALNSVGVALSGAAAWMAAGQLEQDHRFAVVKQTKLHRGDILVHGKSPTHPYGHICVYLGHGVEASDHIQHLISNGSYGRTLVFRPTGGGPVVASPDFASPTGSGGRKPALRSRHAGASVEVASRHRSPHSVVVAAGAKSPIKVAYGDLYSKARPPIPHPPQPLKPPAPTAAEIAQAKHEADLFAYLYDQGAVSGNEAKAKMQAWKALESAAGDKLASSQ